ncbi:MAG: hypothetical protein H0W64_00265 [Gammaproteobacteria bacterium]|nr:hypothetical protein [Gammaproteobacteria bacterium]
MFNMNAQNIIAKQSLQYQFFSQCPTLLNALSERAVGTLDQFLKDSAILGLTGNWAKHLHFLNWLQQDEKLPSHLPIIKELIVASLTQWALSGFDHPEAQGLLIALPHLPSQQVGLWKNQEPDQPHRIISIAQQKCAFKDIHYTIANIQGQWHPYSWQLLPL